MTKRKTKNEKPQASTAFFKEWENEAGDVSLGLFGYLADGTEVCVRAYVDECYKEIVLADSIKYGDFAS